MVTRTGRAQPNRWCYENGLGVPRNTVEAAKWYRRAAYQGHAHGQNNLGRCYENGWGVAKDLKQAAKWYKKSALQVRCSMFPDAQLQRTCDTTWDPLDK